MAWIELALFLACILIGARIGGIGLGTIAGGAGLLQPVLNVINARTISGNAGRGHSKK